MTIHQVQPQDPRGENLIPFPGPASPQAPATGARVDPAPEVVEGELLGEPDYTRWPMPVVLPPWLRSRETALGTLWWGARYAGRHVAFGAPVIAIHEIESGGGGISFQQYDLACGDGDAAGGQKTRELPSVHNR